MNSGRSSKSFLKTNADVRSRLQPSADVPSGPTAVITSLQTGDVTADDW